jgi:hypothetical protein
VPEPRPTRPSTSWVGTALDVDVIVSEEKAVGTLQNTRIVVAVVVGTDTEAKVQRNCGTDPGPVPVPRLREKPSNGGVGLQIVMADVAATDACPARKIPSIALFYTPSKDFVGKDPVQVEFETGDNKIPGLSLISVQAVE